MANKTSSVLQVVIMRDGLLVGTEVFLPGAYRMGSSAEADLRLDDPSVDPIHATLHFKDGKIAVEDKGSKAGLFVNGNKVKVCQIRSIDELMCGPFVIKARPVSSQGANPSQLQSIAEPVAAKPARPLSNKTTVSSRSERKAAREPVRETDDEEEHQTEIVSISQAESVSPPITRERRRPPRLHFELYWGRVRRECKSFQFDPHKPVWSSLKPDDAGISLWGFSLPEKKTLLAESVQGGFRLYIPPKARVARQNEAARFTPLKAEDFESPTGRRTLLLSNRTSVLMTEGPMALKVYVGRSPETVPRKPLKDLPWLAINCFLVIASLVAGFLIFGPKPAEGPDFTVKNLAPVAVRLLGPEPKKKEKAKELLKEIKAKAPKEIKAPKVAKIAPTPAPKKEVVVEKALPPPLPSKALKALAKLSAAGPAMNKVLAAMDKMGGGPGSKSSNSLKFSGLIGKGPIVANSGIGNIGFGGGGGGGFGTKGAEILRGAGGGGIGALGAGNVGRGTVGATVSRASARHVGVQGNIDRDAVAKTVNAHIQEIFACYERQLLKETGLTGKVAVEWTISTSGRVVTAKIKSSTLRSAAVEGCILEKLKVWQFPPAIGGVVVISYPFMFNSVGY